MEEFVSRLEGLAPAEELVFPPTPGFGKYRQFLEHAIPHPAKMNTELLEFLVLKYSREGDLILDPMAGTGSTCVIAALNGRDAVCVEIEPRFYEWMEEARKRVEAHKTLRRKGRIVNVLGDARRLSELLSQNANTVITSPPYAQTISHRSGGSNVRVSGVGISTITARTYSTSDDNIGNLPLGDVDAIITSPPYESALEGTSRHTRGGIASRDPKLARTVMYSPNPDNIGNLKNRDEDYELLEREEDINTLYSRLLKDGKPTYLSEMLLVYKECFKVLKPGGHCVVVVKPFIREKKVIDLPYYTWLLMRRVGFRLKALHKLRLEQESFWRKLYYRKFPNVPRIAHEYVIVCEKPE